MVKVDKMLARGEKDNIPFSKSINGNDAEFNHTLRGRGGGWLRGGKCDSSTA